MNTCRTCRYFSWRRDENGCRMCTRAGGVAVDATDSACVYYKQHTREFFQRVANADRRLSAMAQQCEHFRELAMQATGNLQAIRVGGTRQRSKVEDGVVNLVDLVREIDERAKELRAWRDEAVSVIDALDDPQAKEVLELRYLCTMGWNEIALRMHYEIAHVHRIHRRALALAQAEIDRRTMDEMRKQAALHSADKQKKMDAM